MVSPEPQVLFKPLVHPLQLTVCTRMICRGNVLGNSQASAEFFCKLGCKARVSVADDLHGQTEAFEYVMEVEASYTFSCDGFRTWEE